LVLRIQKGFRKSYLYFLSAWPKNISGPLKYAGEGIKVVAVHGMPSSSILDFLEKI
jgi:hypothetical protein